MNARLGLTALLVALLAGCGNAPPVPTDRFYRLSTMDQASGPALSDKTVLVRAFAADGVHGERAILYSTDPAAVELEQHHYVYWIEPPPRLIQTALMDRLRAAAGAGLVTDDAKIDPALTIRGRVRQFERVLGTEPAVVVALELRLDDAAGKPMLMKNYAARVVAGDDEVPAAVDAFARALHTVFDAFLADARGALAE